MRRESALGLALLAATFVGACDGGREAPYVGVARDSAGVRIVELPPMAPGETVEDLVIDSAWTPASDIQIGDLSDIAVVADRGVLLLDVLALNVTFLSHSGEVLGVIGREGQGPGEFDPQGLGRIVCTDSSVFVPDLFLQRLTEFSLDGEVLGTRAFPLSPVYAVDWRAHPAGGLAFRAFEQFGDQIIRLDGEVLDTLYSSRVSNDFSNLLLAPVTLWDLAETGDVYFGRSDRAAVELHRQGTGELVWRARWPVSDDVLGDGDVGHLEDLVRENILRQSPQISAEALAGNLSLIQYPERLPVLAGILAAPGGDVWVRRARPVREMDREALRVGSAAGFGAQEWDVLDGEGFLRDRVRFPSGFTPRKFHGQWIYGILADEMGVEVPARVRSPR